MTTDAHLHAVPEGPDERYTDVGNSKRLIELINGDYRWVPAWGTWLVWDGKRWAIDTKGTIVEQAKQVAEKMFIDAKLVGDYEERKKLRSWAFRTESAGRIEAMVKLARTQTGIPIDPDELDRGIWRLNVLNGTIDLRTGKLFAHRREDLATKLAPVTFDPTAPADRFGRFLEQIFPDPELLEFVARWFGYCLTGSVVEHKIPFCWGSGDNGKSTLLNAIAAVMGDYAAEAAQDLLLKRMNDVHPTGLADLHGARLVLASETADNRKLDEALVKRLTGGDKVKARRMHKDFFEFDATHKIVVATNHKPGIDGTDHGIWRRVRLIPFDVRIAEQDKDKDLPEKLAEEAAGILAWAVDGCLRWQAGGLTEPTAVIAATADYRNEMDIVGAFISDCCLLNDQVSCRASTLHTAYSQWADDQGEKSISQRKLGAALRERGLTKHTNNGVVWDGIGLKARDTEPSDTGRLDI